jgi:Tol biopolymer transport system component
VEETATGDKNTLAALPIPQGSGSSLPDAANLSWSRDGDMIVFEFGRSAADRIIYIAFADGSGLVKAVESGHAPTISADGKCLAFIRNRQVFLLDLAGMTPASSPGMPILLAELPPGRASADFRLDKLQWKP